MKKKWYVLIVAVILAALCAVAAGFYAEYLEIEEIGKEYTEVFFTDIFARVKMMAILFVVIFIISCVNLFVLKKNIQYQEVTFYTKRKFLLLISGVLAFFGAIAFSGGLYKKFLLFTHTVKADVTDPIFGFDITYFFFTRDFLQSAATIVVTLLVIAFIISAALYLATSAEKDKEGLLKTFSDIKIFSHLATIIVLIFLLAGFLCYLGAQGVVLESNSLIHGATYTDVNISIPFYRACPFIFVAVSVLALIFIARKKIKHTICTILVVPVLFILLGIVTAAVQALYVSPNEATLEEEYIEHNINYTRIGYKLDDVTKRTFPADESLTREDIEQRRDIVDNIRITDPQATLDVLNSTKSIRNYYTFNDTDIVEYEINSHPTAVSISAREIDVNKLDKNADNYINRTLKYTHGYGIVMNPVNSVTSEGQPDCIISDMPVTSKDGAPVVTEPRIYYGEKTNNYCIVNTKINEIDYSLNNENIEKNYEGDKAGIEMSLLNRLIFSIKNRDYTMLISGYITSDSRLLTNRNVLERVHKAVPFMYVDNDPYIVIDGEGRLKWIVDLYTMNRNMPYSDMYIRNSAKAVVDAYHGTVEVYVTDMSDSIVMTYAEIYPSVLKKEAFPEDLKGHIRYPEYLFNLQSEKYLRYHVDNAGMFYSNSDLWMKASEKYRGNNVVTVQPYYNLLALEDFGEDEAQLVLMAPFVPANKENLVSWLAADSDGNLISYTFPAGRTVYGTLHIENRIDADAEISKELSLWDQGGSTVLRGNVLVIPIKNSLIYVEPIYITTANSAAVPEVKRIIVAYGDRIVMKETLDECFDELFGKAGEIPEEASPEEIPSEEVENAFNNAKALVDAYDKMHSAMRNGNWTEFGEAMDSMEKEIEKIR